MKVITLKLVSGEEWIAKHQETMDKEFYVLETVRKLQVVPNGKGGPGLALTPILMGNVEAEDFVIARQHVLLTVPVDPEFEKQYLQQVTGIHLV